MNELHTLHQNLTSVLTKAELRVRMKAVRSSMGEAEVRASSLRIQERLLALDEVRRAETLVIYVAVGKEVATEGLIRHLLGSGKRVAIPRVLNSTSMEACEIREWGDWPPGVMGIPSPRAGSPLSTPMDVCIVPGLAFSSQGDRLGFGCGHWDRFLEKTPAATVIGLCHDQQVVDALRGDR
ncbi:MAG TPA: 5-formyltetrahydrofolate cyclo-ligase [Thermoanaerobaculia bacterium]|jgi:5-formyltetrahydrofolate cyclo-ligase